MNLTKIKKALAHASQQELKDVIDWITARDLELTKREKEARENEAWDRVKNLRPGDYVFVCAGKLAAWKKGTRLTVRRIMPRKRILTASIGKEIPSFAAHSIALMDLRPNPTDDVREAAMRLLLEQ